MKVVFLAQGAFSSIGGIQRFNTRLIQSLSQISCDDVECEVEVMIRSDSTRDLPNNMPGVVMESFSGAAAGFAWRSLLSAVRAQRIILGHINFLPLAVLFRLLNPRASVYMIAHGIEVWGGAEFRAYRWWEPLALRKCVDHILSVSEFTAKKIVDHTGYKAEKIINFPNVIDVDVSDVPVDAAVRSSATILTVTRLSGSERKKNVNIVISAIAELKKIGIVATLHVVGDGELLGELKALAADLAVDTQVVFHGKVSDEQLNLLYRSASIFVLPSEKEGFGIVYLEAWKNGLPVIAAKATAIPEVVDDGVDGLVIYPVEPAVLCRALAKLIDDPVLARKMVENGRRKISDKFNHPAFVRRLKAALKVL